MSETQPRNVFPDSERCNECGARWPMGVLTDDDYNGGWLCPKCGSDDQSESSPVPPHAAGEEDLGPEMSNEQLRAASQAAPETMPKCVREEIYATQIASRGGADLREGSHGYALLWLAHRFAKMKTEAKEWEHAAETYRQSWIRADRHIVKLESWLTNAQEELWALQASAAQEKEYRIRWQDRMYKVCAAIDHVLGYSARTGNVTTVDNAIERIAKLSRPAWLPKV